jgi:hypothetical protein
MKRFAVSLGAVVVIVLCSQAAEAQWVTRYYRPRVVMAPAPVMMSPAPFVMAPVQVVQKPVPMFVHKPEVVVATRRRPILGGTVVRTNYGNRRVMF